MRDHTVGRKLRAFAAALARYSTARVIRNRETLGVETMGQMKSLLFKTHLPANIEDAFEALVDRSIDEMYFGPNDPRVAPVDVDAARVRELIDSIWGELLSEDARTSAVVRFLDLHAGR